MHFVVIVPFDGDAPFGLEVEVLADLALGERPQRDAAVRLHALDADLPEQALTLDFFDGRLDLHLVILEGRTDVNDV